jgi:diguanylate cyclase (GGDEF)-like protein
VLFAANDPGDKKHLEHPANLIDLKGDGLIRFESSDTTRGTLHMSDVSLGWGSLDGLSGDWYVLRELQHHIKLYKRYRHPFSLLLLSFDNLGLVKEASGDGAQESALEYLMTVIETHVREVDLVFRWGGEEFVVIMQETEKNAAQGAARRLVDSVNRTSLKVGEGFVTLQGSFGTASCPEDGYKAEELLETAGRAKQLGRR